MNPRVADLQRFADEHAIHRQLVTYARAVDRRDWDLLRTVFHHDAFDSHGPYKGDVEGFIAFLSEAIQAARTTVHTIGNSTFHFVDDDRAHVETTSTAFHREQRRDGSLVDLTFGVRYLDVFARVNGEWKIASRRVLMDYSRADDVLQTTRAEATFEAGRVDEGDPSVEFLAADASR